MDNLEYEIQSVKQIYELLNAVDYAAQVRIIKHVSDLVNDNERIRYNFKNKDKAAIKFEGTCS